MVKTKEQEQIVVMNPPNANGAKYQIGWMMLTPTIAQDLLKNLGPQRTLVRSVVEDYSNSMKQGRWNSPVSDPIHINEKGELCNGRHRCEAVVISESSIWTWVIRGVSNDSYFEEDTGRNRSMADILTMNKEANGEKLATTLFYLHAFQKGQLGISTAARVYGDKRLLYQFFKKHPSLSACVASTFHRMNHMPIKICPLPSLSFLVYVLEHIDLKTACSFFQVILNERAPNFDDGCPASLMLKRLQDEVGKAERGKKMTVRERMANLIKAWNFYVQNRRVNSIRQVIWRIDESWPDFTDSEGKIITYRDINWSVKAM